MKLTKKFPLISAPVLLILFVLFFTGCGNNEAAPDGSTITLSPASAALINPPVDTVQNFTVVVRYSDGTPAPYMNIHIDGAFAAPTWDGYQFYYYPDGMTHASGNAAVDNGFNAQTDKYGVYSFSIVLSGSPFDDTINVTSGTAVGTATISVTIE